MTSRIRASAVHRFMAAAEQVFDAWLDRRSGAQVTRVLFISTVILIAGLVGCGLVCTSRAQESAPTEPAARTMPEDPLEAAVFLLSNDESASSQQYVAARYLEGLVAEQGREVIPPGDRRAIEAFVTRSLKALCEVDNQDVRMRGGIATILAPIVPTDEVQLAMLETLELCVDRIAWRKVFFDAIRSIPVEGALDHFRRVVAEFAALEPEELAAARYPYPIGEAFLGLAVLGGGSDAERLAPFLRDGVPATIRYRAIEALGRMDGARSLELLHDQSGEASSIIGRAVALALLERDETGGALLLLRVAPDPQRDRAAWARLSLAANRSFESEEEVRAWAEEGAGRTFRQRRLEAFVEAGYEVGDLTRIEELHELLRAVETGEEVTRRNAWAEFTRLVGRDPSSGRFWTALRREPGGSVLTIGKTFGEELPAEDAAVLAEQQAVYLARAKDWVRENEGRVAFDPEVGAFVPSEGRGPADRGGDGGGGE